MQGPKYIQQSINVEKKKTCLGNQVWRYAGNEIQKSEQNLVIH
jgi:hypothetical protein